MVEAQPSEVVPTQPASGGPARYAMPAAGAVAAILVVIGSVMPWASLTTPFGTVSAAGTEGDGKLTLVAGLALLCGAVASAVVQ